jgi:hypothetical protein
MRKFFAVLLLAGSVVTLNKQMSVAQDAQNKDKAAQSKTDSEQSMKSVAGTNAKTSTDPWMGTWKMDTRQSKLHGPAPKEETLVIEAANADHIKYTIHSVGQDSEYTLAYDGKPDAASAVTMNSNPAGTATYHRITNQKYSGIATMGKSLTTSETITLSSDKKKVTVKIHAKSDKEQYEEIAVYTR